MIVRVILNVYILNFCVFSYLLFVCFVSTPDYLAPEVVSGSGHGFGVDWWTLGILIYEMLSSYPPFYDEDHLKTYQKIMTGNIQYPTHLSKESIDLISKLCNLKPTKRLGVIAGGTSLIKSHPWFKGFDWDKFEKKLLPAPIKISSRNQEEFIKHIQNKYLLEKIIPIQQYIPDSKRSNWDKEF